jgi:hypothetical protein
MTNLFVQISPSDSLQCTRNSVSENEPSPIYEEQGHRCITIPQMSQQPQGTVEGIETRSRRIRDAFLALSILKLVVTPLDVMQIPNSVQLHD